MRQWAINRFQREGIEPTHVNADELLAHCMGITREELCNVTRPLNEKERKHYKKLVERRLNREPLQQILGHWGFWSLDLRVTRDVMVPRSETECLVEEALNVARTYKNERIRILDLGTGSGNIAIALAHELSRAQVIATDISREALEVARDNAQMLGLEERILFLQGDLFLPVDRKRFDLIVSNPPYIPTAVIKSLDPEIRCFEPIIALDGGEDGLGLLRRIIAQAGRHLSSGGWLFLEAGEGQAQSVAEMMDEKGFQRVGTVKDILGIPRVVKGSWGWTRSS